MISGEHVFLLMPFGVELPLNYKTNGEVAGQCIGISAASMFTPGRRRVSGGIQGKQLCQQWPSWYKGRQFCFTIQKTGKSTISVA